MGFESRHGEGAVELDALEALYPGELQAVLSRYIECYYDSSLSERVAQAQARLHEDLSFVWQQVLTPYTDERGPTRWGLTLRPFPLTLISIRHTSTRRNVACIWVNFFERSGRLLFMLYSCICASKELGVLISMKERDVMTQPSLQPKSTKSPFQNHMKPMWQGIKSSSQRVFHSLLQPGLQSESGITFFPLRFEEYLYTHWYLFSIGLYLVIMILGVSLDIAYAYHSHFPAFYYIQHDFHDTYLYSDLTDWIYILGVVAVSLIAVAFNSWRRNIHTIFQALISKDRLRSARKDGDVHQEYRRFLESYQHALLSKKRYFLLGTMMLILIGYFLWSIPQAFSYYSSLAQEEAPLLGILGFIRYVVGTPFALLLESYILATGTWVLCITGMSVRKLAIEFNFNIQPAHPDHCGGLRALGDLCFGIALPILIFAILLAVYSICGLLLPLSGLLEPILADFLLIPFVLPLAAIAFFVPLWKIHQKMISQRDTEADSLSNRVMALKETIESLLDKGNLEEAKVTKEKLEIIQALHPDNESYPTWPFDRGILLKFLAPQIVSVLSLLIQLGPVIDALKHILRLS